MNFEDIKNISEHKVLNVKFKDEKKLNFKEKKQLVSFMKTKSGYYLKLEKEINKDIQFETYQIDLDNDTEAYIDKILDKNLNYLAQLENIDTVSIVIFNFSILNMDFPFLIDDNLLKKNKFATIKNKLEENYLIKKFDNKSYAILGVIKAETEEQMMLIGKENLLLLKKVIKDFYIEDESSKDFKKIEQQEVYSIVEEKKLKDFKIEDCQMFMLAGTINFCNNTDDFRMKIQDKITMREIQSDPASYLNLWNKYADFEMDLFLKEIKNSGYFEILSYKQKKINNKEIIELELDKVLEINENTVLRVVDKNPKDLFKDYTAETEKEFFSTKPYDCDVVIAKNNSKSNIIQVHNNNKFSEGKWKYIFLSIKGNNTVFKRREKARKLISKNLAGIPNLNQLIEGKIPHQRAKEKKNYKALSVQTKKSLFPKYDPTETQQEAIEIALNTPDIALIQGPPGTGKTTVITGILQRLSEIKKDVGNLSGGNLITSFQHDAVTNATGRIKILGLPAEKYGQKNGSDGQILNDVFKHYITQTLQNLYDENINLKRLKEEDELLALYSRYSDLETSPEKSEIKLLLKSLQKFALNYDLQTVLEKLDRLKADLDSVNKDYSTINKNDIFKLPITKKMLEDNGDVFIKNTIRTLESEIQSGKTVNKKFSLILDFLKKCLETNNIDFKIMKRCKDILLSELTYIEDIFLTSNNNKMLNDIFSDLDSEIERIKTKSKDHKERLKLKFIDELENNPLRVRDTVRSYMTTFAATCQQTQSNSIKIAKNNGNKVKSSKDLKLEDHEKYENVLVDEAARSNPPDLLIPMAMATERIILVGDHKQLPHIVNEEILNYMDDSKGDKSIKEELSDGDILKTSMFEILEKKCKDLEKLDGVKRTIMLDKQYRMHPTMGSFVSKHFYNNKLKNGIEDPSRFKSSLKDFEDKALAWYDIPYSKKFAEQTRNNSKYRNIEAKEIAKFLYKNIDNEELKGKNFGVITFYAEQREEIFKELANLENRVHENQRPLVIQEGKLFKVNDYYANSKENNIDEKLRIGSVDSFQGMEFDYVCLSMVRSNEILLKTEKDVRAKFGFLTNPNRLCVAMSRQKKLVIMFGDSKMLEGQSFKDIEVLQDYLNLCKGGDKYGQYKSVLS